MNIEQLGPDKLRVSLSFSDLNRYDLDYFSISTESQGTKRMLKEILFQAEKETGFNTANCRLLIEVLPGKNDGCTLYLTKLPVKEENGAKKKQRVRYGERTRSGNSYILSCGNIDDTISAINCFALYPDIPLVNSSLYNFGGKYHLTFAPVCFGLDKSRLYSLLADLSEYGEAEKSTPVREAMLAEHGDTITTGRAVENFMRYFH